MGTNKYNKSAYDQRLIRFPRGTLQRFKELFGNDVSFNSWVVNLVTSRLLLTEEKRWNWTTKDRKL